MTDLATVQPTALAVPVSGDASGLTVLEDWLAAAGNAEALARQLVHSFFVPAAYKPSGPNGVEVAVANATGAILLGQSLGLDPLTSLQQIYVVHGRPGMYARMKVALAQAAGHRIWEEEYSPERSTWAGQRKGSEDVVRITVTIEDAKRAGWTSNAAYGKTPADMLAARCSSRVVDRIAADALFGIRSIEDLQDGPEEPARPSAEVRASVVDDLLSRPLPTPAALAATAVTAPAERAADDEVPTGAKPKRTRKAAEPKAEPAPEPGEPAATSEQLAHMVDLAASLGMTTAESRRDYIASLIPGFDPGAGLNRADADLVIAALADAVEESSEAMTEVDPPETGDEPAGW